MLARSGAASPTHPVATFFHHAVLAAAVPRLIIASVTLLQPLKHAVPALGRLYIQGICMGLTVSAHPSTVWYKRNSGAMNTHDTVRILGRGTIVIALAVAIVKTRAAGRVVGLAGAFGTR